MKLVRFFAIVAVAIATLCLFAKPVSAQVPQLINYQGRIAVSGTNFTGTGQFKFALVSGSAPVVTYWSNDGTGINDSAPTNAVPLTVAKGLYSVLLGDATIANMTALPATVFTNPDVRLRVWFNDGTHDWQQLTPDQRIAAVGYAMVANTAQIVPDGSITSAKIASGAIQGSNIATGTIIPSQSVSGTAQAAAANTSYVVSGTSPAAFTLPDTANVGDIVQITGVGAGGWSVVSPWVLSEDTRKWTSVVASGDGTRLVGVGDGHVYTSSDSGATWTQRSQSFSPNVVVSSLDGTKLVAMEGGSISTSSDSGATWTAPIPTYFTPKSPVRVASSFDCTKLVTVDTSGHISTSSDSGATWTQCQNSFNAQSVASSADGTKLVATGNGGNTYVFTSSDFGMSWKQRDAHLYPQCVASSADGTKLVAMSGGSLSSSSDSGVTWTIPAATNFSPQSIVSSFDGTRLVALDNNGLIYISNDLGATWTQQPASFSAKSVVCSSDGTKLVAVGADNHLYTSNANLSGNQGSTATLQCLGSGQWTALSPQVTRFNGMFTGDNILPGTINGSRIATGTVIPSQNISGTAQNAVGNTSYVVSGTSPTAFTLPTTANVGDIVQIADVGAGGWSVVSPWVQRQTSFSASSLASSADGTKLVAGDAYSAYTSRDSGVTWTQRSAPFSPQQVLSSLDGTKLVALRSGTISSSSDSGATWTTPTPIGFTPVNVVPVASSADCTKLAALGGDSHIHTSNDSGATWTTQQNSFSPPYLASSADGTKLAVAGTDNRVYTSSDSGVTWAQRSAPFSPQQVVASFDGTKLVAIGSGTASSSSDFGATWTAAIPTGFALAGPPMGLATSADCTKLAAVDINGRIYTSSDSGATWTQQQTSFIPRSVVSSADGTKLVAVDYNGRIYTSDANLSGNQGSTATVQYLGGGQWVAVGSSQQASGLVVASNLIATNLAGNGAAVTNVNAATLNGLNSSAFIANGTSTQAGASFNIDGSGQVGTNLTLPNTASSSTGVLKLGGIPFLHAYSDRSDQGLNTFVGYNAGNFTMTGTANTASGATALSNNTIGSNNTAIGASALSANNIGNDNTAVGRFALKSNTTSSMNTAIGSGALYSSTTGSENTATGYSALYTNGKGNYNTAIGSGALNTNTTGSDNTAVGHFALKFNSGGSANTAYGSGALFSCSGSNNIGIGFSAGVSLTTGSNNIDIGNSGVSAESNAIHIGIQGTQTATFIAGISGVTLPSGATVSVDSSGRLGVVTSSARFKQDIQNMDAASSVLLSLNPVTFRYKPQIDPQSTPQFGLVAEEVEKISPDLVLRDAKGQVYTVRYEAVNAMLLNEFLKEHKRVEDQGKTITEQQKLIKEMATRLNELDEQMRQINERMKTADPQQTQPILKQ